ncbi:MAG: TIR domain-containing protein, partial [Anaerolineales bacterium]
MATPDKSKVFISYSRRDTRLVEALARDLKAAGVTVWMDQAGISVGERWSAAIQQALEESYAMVLVVSPDSMASANVEDEFTYFLDAKKPIVPIMVREAKMHYQLNRLQRIDFTRADHTLAYEDLIRALYKVGVAFAPQDDKMDAAQHSIISELIREIEAEKRATTRRRAITGALAAALAITVLVIVGLLIVSSEEDNEGAPQAGPVLAEFIIGRINGPNVPLYDQPSRDATVVVEALPEGKPVFVYERTPDGRFLRIESGLTEEGFVLRTDVDFDDPDAPQQIAVYVSPTPAPTPTPTPFVSPTPTVTPSPT